MMMVMAFEEILGLNIGSEVPGLWGMAQESLEETPSSCVPYGLLNPSLSLAFLPVQAAAVAL